MAATLRNQLPDATDTELRTIASVQPHTMTSPERLLALCRAVDYIEQNAISGDIVECGVWRGGSMMAAVQTLNQRGSHDRRLWLYDTFDGMSEPTEDDVDFMGNTATRLLDEQSRDDATSVWCRSQLDEVKNNLRSCGYPEQNTTYVQGKVEETIPTQQPEQIAILRLDTDWYESTRHEMIHLFPRLSPGGVLIVDDYGHWEGCRRAIDEYLSDNEIPLLLNRIDYTGRIGVYWPSKTVAATQQSQRTAP